MTWQDIPGWTCKDTLALYSEWANDIDRGTIVEVGCAYGRSFAFLGSVVRRRVDIVAVDLWSEHMGGDNLHPSVFERMQSYGSPIESFRTNLELHGPDRHMRIVQGESTTVAQTFDDWSVDAVFIDADHRYEHVRADIAAWLPKVRRGGMIAGHDYESREFPGVVQAVKETFGDAVEVRGVVWRHWVPT